MVSSLEHALSSFDMQYQLVAVISNGMPFYIAAYGIMSDQRWPDAILEKGCLT